MNQVYWLRLPHPSLSLQQLTASLSCDERERAARYRFEAGRHSFVTGRAMLRELLASRLGGSAATVKFVYGPHGKPHVLDETGREKLHFSVTNTADLVAIALSPNRIGIDAEKLTQRDYFDLYDLTLSPSEKNYLQVTPVYDRERSFLRMWTRKEALLKAAGTGLSDDLPKTEVIAGDTLWQMAADPEEGLSMQPFSVCDLDLGADFVSAIAVQSVEAPVVTTFPFETFVSRLP